ncbi:PUF domain-containing protein [Cephalotus follicularis]|uniref:PUF domain-containing protein n=1 Tax=Cephalotus follicularis TaxID=3775 RepID=A0A1Q3CM19_CEPFO|nr:PUF domain-containing protein [Cephalotus follicularis]
MKRVSTGFVAPSSSCNNASCGCGSLVGRDYRESNYLNFVSGIVNQDSYLRWPCEEANPKGLSNPQNLDNAEICFESLEGPDFFKLGLELSGSKYLTRMLYLKDPRITGKIFDGVIGSIFKLMTDQNGHYLFGKLIRFCDDIQLQFIVAKITVKSESFINAAKDRWGSISIKNLIKVLERSHYVSSLIVPLYDGFYGLMIDRIGSSVVVKCIDILDTATTVLLYQAAIKYCLELATNEKGYFSLNNFITNSKGLRRQQLLDLISENSLFLALDPYGNFVLQHVLKLHNPFLIEKICSGLKGHYIRLSQLKVSSHVVEQCIDSVGIKYVLFDFLRSNDLIKVAQNQYGNYVIQQALKIAKQTDNPFYHNLLMKLEPLLDSKYQPSYGLRVVNFIKKEIPVRNAMIN